MLAGARSLEVVALVAAFAPVVPLLLVDAGVTNALLTLAKILV